MISSLKNKNFPILIIGFGSIGQRHYQNLLQLGYKNVSVYDIKPKRISPEVKLIKQISPIILANFAVVFICNPTSEHINTALKCALAGRHLFIEKPLSHNLKGIDKLIKLCRQKKLVTMVGCNFRFHLGFKLLAQVVKDGSLGKPLTARVIIGHDLSKSRPGVDYRNTYAAKNLGGGVILDSGAHALDYLTALFGEIKKGSGVYGRISDLEIESEDFANLTLVSKSGVVISLMLDYFSKPKRHRVEIQFTAGQTSWDFAAEPIQKRNAMYLAEIKHFMELVVGKRDDNPQNLKDAYQVLTILAKIKKQALKL